MKGTVAVIAHRLLRPSRRQDHRHAGRMVAEEGTHAALRPRERPYASLNNPAAPAGSTARNHRTGRKDMSGNAAAGRRRGAAWARRSSAPSMPSVRGRPSSEGSPLSAATPGTRRPRPDRRSQSPTSWRPRCSGRRRLHGPRHHRIRPCRGASYVAGTTGRSRVHGEKIKAAARHARIVKSGT